MLDNAAPHGLSRKFHDGLCSVKVVRGRFGQMSSAPVFRAGCKIAESEASLFQSRRPIGQQFGQGRREDAQFFI